jgi:hypothetical protein
VMLPVNFLYRFRAQKLQEKFSGICSSGSRLTTWATRRTKNLLDVNLMTSHRNQLLFVSYILYADVRKQVKTSVALLEIILSHKSVFVNFLNLNTDAIHIQRKQLNVIMVNVTSRLIWSYFKGIICCSD